MGRSWRCEGCASDHWQEQGLLRAGLCLCELEILTNQPQLFAGLNGLLLPGGSAPLVGTGGFAEVGQFFFEMAKEVRNVLFKCTRFSQPMLGTRSQYGERATGLNSSLSSHLATSPALPAATLRTRQATFKNKWIFFFFFQASPLHMLPPAPLSKVFGLAPPDVLRELQTERISINFHHFCLTPENFTRYNTSLIKSLTAYCQPGMEWKSSGTLSL